MDLYEVLGIDRKATLEQVHTAYRELVRRWHPDVCSDPESVARFREIQRAYEVLGGRESRASYDRRTGQSIPVNVGPRRASSGRVREVSSSGPVRSSVREVYRRAGDAGEPDSAELLHRILLRFFG